MRRLQGPLQRLRLRRSLSPLASVKDTVEYNGSQGNASNPYAFLHRWLSRCLGQLHHSSYQCPPRRMQHAQHLLLVTTRPLHLLSSLPLPGEQHQQQQEYRPQWLTSDQTITFTHTTTTTTGKGAARASGGNDPDTLNGDHIQRLHRLLRANAAALGEAHPDTAALHLRLATAFEKQGRLAQAIPHLQTAVAARCTALGRHHSHTAASAMRLGEALLRIHKDACLKDAPGVGHGINGSSGNGTHTVRSADREAAAAFALAAEAYEHLYGLTHPTTAKGYYMLAMAYDNMEEPDLALRYFMRCLRARLESLGEEHPLTATSYASVGSLLMRHKGDLHRALDHYQSSLRIRRNHLHPDHPLVASTWNHVATLRVAVGLPGLTSSTDRSSNRSRIANSQHTQQNETSREDLSMLQQQERRLRLLERSSGAQQAETQLAYAKLASAYEECGQLRSALQIMKRHASAFKHFSNNSKRLRRLQRELLTSREHAALAAPCPGDMSGANQGSHRYRQLADECHSQGKHPLGLELRMFSCGFTHDAMWTMPWVELLGCTHKDMLP